MKLTITKLLIFVVVLLLIITTTSVVYADSNLSHNQPNALMLKEINRVTEKVKVVTPPPVLTQEQIINGYVESICKTYSMDSAIIKSIIWHESRYNPNASNGNCLGLMQISTRWHTGRAEKLGVTDFYDIQGNILLGIDYFSELLNNCKDPALALMAYNMGYSRAIELYNAGHISNYAQSVLEKAKDI